MSDSGQEMAESHFPKIYFIGLWVIHNIHFKEKCFINGTVITNDRYEWKIRHSEKNKEFKFLKSFTYY